MQIVFQIYLGVRTTSRITKRQHKKQLYCTGVCREAFSSEISLLDRFSFVVLFYETRVFKNT